MARLLTLQREGVVRRLTKKHRPKSKVPGFRVLELSLTLRAFHAQASLHDPEPLYDGADCASSAKTGRSPYVGVGLSKVSV